MSTLEEAQQMLNAYRNTPDPQGFIRDTITKNVYNDLRPEVETLAHYEQSTLPSFYNAFSGYGMGTGAADMSPTAKMQSAMADVARQSAMAQTARGVLDTRRMRMEDLIGRFQDQWRQGYGMARDQYDMSWQQQLEQRRQMEADRAYELQRQAAARQGAGYAGFDYNKLLELLGVGAEGPRPGAGGHGSYTPKAGVGGHSAPTVSAPQSTYNISRDPRVRGYIKL